MLRTGADVGKAQFLQQRSDMAFVIIDAETFLDLALEIDAPPANDTVARRVGAGFHDLRQLGQLLLGELAGSTGGLAVDQTVRSLPVEAQDPVPQCLPIHAAHLRSLSAAHSVKDRSKRQKTAALAGILAFNGKAAKIGGTVIGA